MPNREATSTSATRAATSESAGAGNRAEVSRRAADVLLREHPDAAVFAQLSDGTIVVPPESLGLEGYPVLAADGRTGVDMAVAEDRMTLVNAWVRLKREAVAEAKARMRSDPGQWRIVRMLDLRNTHGVVLSIVWPTGERCENADEGTSAEPVATTPRFCWRKQDEEGNVVECDEAYLQMFGLAETDVIGKPTFEMVHPDDQARVIEGWIATVATGRVQMFRIRMRRDDGGWIWVDTTLHNFLGDAEKPHVLAECIDVSAEMRAHEALEDREELLRRLIEEMPDGLLQLDSDCNVVYCNTRLSAVLHSAGAAVAIGAHESAAGSASDGDEAALDRLLSRLTPSARAAFDAVVSRSLRRGIPEDVEVEVAPPEVEARYVLMKVRPLKRQSGVVSGTIISALDVTDGVHARRELEKRATFDSLTGSHNRSSIIATLEHELEGSRQVGVLYVDLDQFKSVNDTLGHAAGDEALTCVAERIKAVLRANDELGRLGGDEFLVLLRGVSDVGVAMEAADRVSGALRGHIELACGGSIDLCASVGAACAGDEQLGAEELIERADAAMYRCKEQRDGIPVLA